MHDFYFDDRTVVFQMPEKFRYLVKNYCSDSKYVAFWDSSWDGYVLFFCAEWKGLYFFFLRAKQRLKLQSKNIASFITHLRCLFIRCYYSPTILFVVDAESGAIIWSLGNGEMYGNPTTVMYDMHLAVKKVRPDDNETIVLTPFLIRTQHC
jgi:hypothetical protein